MPPPWAQIGANVPEADMLPSGHLSEADAQRPRKADGLIGVVSDTC